MKLDSLPLYILGTLVVVGIVAGFFTVGGPLQGRMERHDVVRADDLREMDGYIACVVRLGDGITLPETLPIEPKCIGSRRLADPFSNQPYSYEKLSDKSFRVCANFEALDKARPTEAPDFDYETGCMTHSYWPPSG